MKKVNENDSTGDVGKLSDMINDSDIRGFIGLVILIIIALFVLTVNVIIIPFDLIRKPVRTLVYKVKNRKASA